MLAAKSSPPRTLLNEIGEDFLFPYHVRVDNNAKLDDTLSFQVCLSANYEIRASLAATLARAGLFHDSR